MNIFMDEEDPAEPVRGIPEELPEGEKIIWQGKPSAWALAINAFRLRWVMIYFAVVTFFRAANISANGGSTAEMTGVATSSLLFAGAAIAVIAGLSFAMSRAALFTITDKRVVLRYGAAIRKHVNLPFSQIQSASMKRKSARVGDIALQLKVPGQPPYLHLWPFVRPFNFSKPQPMIRGVEQPEEVARILAQAVFAQAPEAVEIELEKDDRPAAPDLTPEVSISAA
ncbi:MAG: photosynthetic complex putative assembly protein PuhB [Pseudomonadota bacterium]